MSEKLWHLKRCNLFERLSPDELQQLERRCSAKTFPRKTPIYLPADESETVFLITTGRAKICHITPDGKQSILAFIEPGELFGELSLLEPGRRDEYAETIDKTTLVMIPGDVMRKLMESHPDVTLSVTKLIGMRRKRVEQRLKNLLFLSNRERLTHLLLELAQQYGKPAGGGVEKNGVELTIRLSHQDLANVIGSTRETVTVVLGELQSEKLITLGRRKITINDLSKLAQSVERPTPTLPDGEGVEAPFQTAKNLFAR